MRFKYKLQMALQFMAFAFYPKTTLIACAVLSAVITVVLCIVIMLISPDSKLYHILFALLTGTAASFFVSFIIELCSNYKHNKLAWHELREYYSMVTEYEVHKQILMQKEPLHQEETINEADLSFQNEMDDYSEFSQGKDIIQATWEQLPKIIPILKQTLEIKKAFLSDDEIVELNAIISSYWEIWHEVNIRLLHTTLIYNALNHPDKEYLQMIYPQNILDDMPKWIKRYVASEESKKAINRLTDTIMADDFLLTEFMKNYDISQHGLDSYDVEGYDDSCDEEVNTSVKDENNDSESNVSDDEMDEELYKAMLEEFNREMEAKDVPFVSWHISHCCLEISESIEILEQIIMKKPYYSFHLKWFKKREKEAKEAGRRERI